MTKTNKLAIGMLCSLGLMSLVACANSTIVSAQAVPATEAMYTIDANLAADYANGNLGIKPDASIITNMQTASKLAKTRIDTLRAAAQAGQTISVAEILLANDAVNAVTTFLQNHGVITNPVTLLPTE
mgnify:CR=1 FL=1